MSAAAALPEIRETERVADISTVRDTKESGMRPGQKFVNFTSNIAMYDINAIQRCISALNIFGSGSRIIRIRIPRS
jgi:hypothetical protein